MLRFCNFESSIEITYMSVAIQPRRFCEHKLYHIILQEVKNLLRAAVQIHDVIHNIEHNHLQSTPLHQCLDRGQGVELNYLDTYSMASYVSLHL